MAAAKEWHHFRAELKSWQAIHSLLMEAAAPVVPEDQLFLLELGTEEAVVNVLRYAYQEEGQIWLSFGSDKSAFTIDIVDFGAPFNPLEQPAKPPLQELSDAPLGGCGITLIKHAFQNIAYSYEEIQGQMANHLHLEYPCSKT